MLNPQAILQMMIRQNPQIVNIVRQIKNATSGAPEEMIARQMAHDAGFNDQQIDQLYNKLTKGNISSVQAYR